jgi:hypothetical protein
MADGEDPFAQIGEPAFGQFDSYQDPFGGGIDDKYF